MLEAQNLRERLHLEAVSIGLIPESEAGLQLRMKRVVVLERMVGLRWQTEQEAGEGVVERKLVEELGWTVQEEELGWRKLVQASPLERS